LINLIHKTEGVNRTIFMRFHPSSFTGKEKDEETGYGYVFRGGRLVNSCSGGREDTKALEFIWKYISFQEIIELFSQNGTIILQPQMIVSNYINQKRKYNEQKD